MIQPVPGRKFVERTPKVALPRNLGLNDSIPLGLVAERMDRGKRPAATARPGRGRIGQPCRNWGWRVQIGILNLRNLDVMLVKLRKNIRVEEWFFGAARIAGVEFTDVAESLVSGQLLPAVVIRLV